MTKSRFFSMGLLVMVAAALSGCTQVKNYSIRSYQGPLPMRDREFVEAGNAQGNVSPQR